MVQILESKELIMKKLLIIAAATIAVANAGLLEDAAKLDVKKACDVKAIGAAKALEVAKKYNPEAVKQGVEFKRLGITNSKYIKAVEEALKNKSKDAVIKYKDKKKDKTKKFPLDYAAWRTCTFAVSALQEKVEAEKTWRLAVPGDGFKF